MTLSRPPTAAEFGFAGLCLLITLPSPLIVLGTLGRLELTANGFRQVSPLLPSRLVPWPDVEGPFVATRVSTVKFVGYRLTAAAQAGGSFFGSAMQRVQVYGMDVAAQASLMDEWRSRWTTA